MQEAALAQAADELYALPPASFREARDEQAARARTAGDRELAAAIRKLRRPTVSAWLVNRLVREARDQLDELLELGEELREAQSVLAGDRLRELSGRRRQLVGELTREARRLAGQDQQPISDQTERELISTLEAALADPAAAAAVSTGRLASALSYAGLGGPDFASAVAVPGAMPGRQAQPAAGRPPEGGRPGAGGQRGRQREAVQHGPAGRQGRLDQAGRDQAGRDQAGRDQAERDRAERGQAERDRAERGQAGRDRAAGAEDRYARAAQRGARAAEREARAAQAARRDLAEAEAAVREAEGALAAAEQQVAAATGQHQAARQRIGELERQLDEAQAEQARTARAAGQARRDRDAAARSLATAQRRLARIQERGGQHG